MVSIARDPGGAPSASEAVACSESGRWLYRDDPASYWRRCERWAIEAVMERRWLALLERASSRQALPAVRLTVGARRGGHRAGQSRPGRHEGDQARLCARCSAIARVTYALAGRDQRHRGILIGAAIDFLAVELRRRSRRRKALVIKRARAYQCLLDTAGRRFGSRPAAPGRQPGG